MERRARRVVVPGARSDAVDQPGCPTAARALAAARAVDGHINGCASQPRVQPTYLPRVRSSEHRAVAVARIMAASTIGEWKPQDFKIVVVKEKKENGKYLKIQPCS